MKAMLLAAGLGERMGKFTQDMPKPLLKIKGQSLIEYHLYALAQAGFKEVVINVSYFAAKIKIALADGKRYGLSITYSVEEEPLETGGGIYNALPLLDNDPFVVINSDVWTDYPLQKLPKKLNGLAHLVLVTNPPNHLQGDFCFQEGKIFTQGNAKLTYSGISVFHPDLFLNCKGGKFPLIDVLLPAIQQEKVFGEYYNGVWADIGTPERLASIDF
jgi:N-acetyl-alpha-D-muramate 1-phosphate uridylyltransferase